VNGFGEGFLLSEDYYGEEDELFGEVAEEAAVTRRPRRTALARTPYARARPPATVTGPEAQKAFDAVRRDVKTLGAAVNSVQRENVRTRRDLAQMRETGQNAAFLSAGAALYLAKAQGDNAWPVVVPPLIPAALSLVSESKMTGGSSQDLFRGNLIPIALLGFLIWRSQQDGGDGGDGGVT
jgi:hypothetical protein